MADKLGRESDSGDNGQYAQQHERPAVERAFGPERRFEPIIRGEHDAEQHGGEHQRRGDPRAGVL